MKSLYIIKMTYCKSVKASQMNKYGSTTVLDIIFLQYGGDLGKYK
jgi:hypothetical protein